MPGTTRRPDFLVEEPGGATWYLEATAIASDEKGAERRCGTLIDALNDLESPNFFVGISWRETGSSSPPAHLLRARVADWLRGLDPDEVLRTPANERPSLKWEHDDWVVALRALPKGPEERGKPARTVGIHSSGAWRDDDEHLRDALGAKARRYGKPPIPFVIALRTTVPFAELDDVLVERPDGGVALPVDARVSALVVAGPEFQAWSVNRITPAFAANDEATHRLRVELPWPRLRTPADMDVAEWQPAADAPALLGIPPDFEELKETRFPR